MRKTYRLALKEVALENDVRNPHQLAELLEISYSHATKFWNQEIKSITIDVINKVCFEFGCTPGDLYREAKDVKQKIIKKPDK